MKRGKIKRPKWLYRHLDRVVEYGIKNGKLIRIKVLQRYKKRPICLTDIQDRNPDKEILWAIGNPVIGWLMLCRYSNNPESVFFFSPEAFWKLEEHDLLKLLAILLRLTLPNRTWKSAIFRRKQNRNRLYIPSRIWKYLEEVS